MSNDIRERKGKEDFGPDTIEEVMRERIRERIEELVEEELTVALGAGQSERVGEARRGYRHGARSRTLTTSLGPTTFSMPRARVKSSEGRTTEWSSQIVPRYQRRTQRVDEAILGVYLSGGNTRRIRGALAPLLKGSPLSKDAVSRLVGRMSEDFNNWRSRDLAADQVRYVMLDGWYPKLRLGKRRERIPVLVALGVCTNGDRILLDLRLAGQESQASWEELLRGLVQRHIGTPVLAIIDGNAGLEAALQMQWPGIRIQRCTAHKLRNLKAKVPVRMREEVAEDYRRMIYAESRTLAEARRDRFVKKWKLQCPAVIESFQEAGDHLFTFFDFPQSQWKALRTTNALERINGEFRRRTKTQASLPGQNAVLLLMFGLLKTGQIRARKIDGWREMQTVSFKQEALKVPA